MLDDVGNRLCFGQLAKDMHMIGNASDDQGRTLHIFQDSGQIGVCSLLEVLTNE